MNVVAVSVLAITFCLTAVSMTSAADGGEIVVRVLDAMSKTPVPHASVRIVNDGSEYDGLTDSSGTSRFSLVQPGSYGVYAREPDFAFDDSTAVVVKAGASLAVTVLGSRARPVRIGAVQSRVSPRPDPAIVQSSDTAAGAIAGSAGAALNSLPPVDGSSRAGTLRIHNEGPSTTTATINGAPIFPSGAKIPASLFAGDVFSSAALGAGTIGAPNGTLDFSTYEPVIDWGGLIQGRIAGSGATADAIMERGTAGRLGISVVHAQSSDATAFDDESFLDTSGSAYVHHTEQRSTSDVMSMRYGFAIQNSGHLDFGRLVLRTPLSCDLLSGPVPCGYGYGGGDNRSTTFVQLRDSAAMQRGTLRFSAFASRSDFVSDDSRQVVEGESVGVASRSAVRRAGGTVAVGFDLSAQRTASLTVSAVSESVDTNAAGTAAQPVPTVNSFRSSWLLSLPAIETRRARGSVFVGSDHAYGATSMILGTHAELNLSARDSVTANFASGRLGSRLDGFDGVDPAQLVNVDCSSGRALGNGPTITTAPGRTRQVDIGYARRSTTYQIGVDVYHHDARNAAVSAVLPASALPSALVSPTYLDTASRIAGAECGTPVTVLPSNLYFTTTAAVSNLVNDGADVSATVDITPRSSATLAYSLSDQRGYGDSPLFVPGSTLHPGQVLPGSTISRLNVTSRYSASRATTLIANANLFGANNPYLGHSFVSLDAAVRTKFADGDVVLALANISNASARTFQVFAPFPVITQGYAARSLSVRARIAIGRQNIDRADYLSRPVRPDASLLAYVPVDYEPRPAQGWLVPTTGADTCGPEQAGRAKRYLDAIASYADRVTRGAIVPPSHLDDMTLSVISAAGTSAIRIEFSRTSRADLSSFLRCTAVHEGNYDQARALGLYVADWRQREEDGIYALYYAPLVGVYTAPDPVNATSGAFVPSMTLPARAPAAPFAVAPACPASLVSAATEMAGQLKAYVASLEGGNRPTAPDWFTVSRHAASAESWLEIRPQDGTIADALTQCLAVPVATSAMIARRGLGGAFPPSINYATSVGLYSKSP